MASDEESGPLTLLEAMACEVPWIATPWGIAVTLTPGEYGLLVPCRAPHAMATAMENLLNHPERLGVMRARCREQVVKYFSEPAYGQDICILLKLRNVEKDIGPSIIPYP